MCTCCCSSTDADEELLARCYYLRQRQSARQCAGGQCAAAAVASGLPTSHQSLPVLEQPLLQPLLVVLIHIRPGPLRQPGKLVKVPVVQDVVCCTPDRLLFWSTGPDGCEVLVGLIQ